MIEIEFKCPTCNKELDSVKQCKYCKQEFISKFEMCQKDINEEYIFGKNYRGTPHYWVTTSNSSNCYITTQIETEGHHHALLGAR